MNISKYINNVSALQSFQIMRFGSLILIGIILVKSGYTKEEIGIYELFFFVANVVSFFWSMGLNNALMSFYPKLELVQQKRLLFNLAIILLALGFAAAGILYLLEDYIAYLLNGSHSIDHLNYIMVYLILAAPSSFIALIYLLQSKNKAIVKYGIFIYLLQLLIITIAAFNHLDVSQILQLVLGWMVVQFLWFTYLIFKNGGLYVDFQLQRTFLIFALPLILHMLLGNGMEYVDGFIVNYFYDEAAFAQFRYGARELPLATILIGALSTAMIPLAVNGLNKTLSEVRRKISNMMNILFPISMALILTSPFIFPLVYSQDYEISAQLFNIYLLVICSRVLMPQVVLFAKHSNNFLMLSGLVEFLINIALSLYLLQFFGMLGIAWATVIAFLINKVMLSVYAKRKFGVNIKQYLDVKLYSIWFGSILICYFISTLYH